MGPRRGTASPHRTGMNRGTTSGGHERPEVVPLFVMARCGKALDPRTERSGCFRSYSVIAVHTQAAVHRCVTTQCQPTTSISHEPPARSSQSLVLGPQSRIVVVHQRV